MKHFLKIFLPVAVFIIVAWLAWWVLVSKSYDDMPSRGQVGDLFGGVNALFSGLALAGVVTAVVLQSHELGLQRIAMQAQLTEMENTRIEISLQREQISLQREELKLTREELKRTAEASEESAKALGAQIKMQIHGARLQGLSTIADVLNFQLSHGTHPGSQIHQWSRSRDDAVRQINTILETLQSEIQIDG